jgi:hypothetical protein
VKGGVEFAPNGDAAQTTNLHWHLDLLRVSIERNLAPDQYSPNGLSSVQEYTRTDYVNRIATQANWVSSSGATPANQKCTRGQADPQEGTLPRQGPK